MLENLDLIVSITTYKPRLLEKNTIEVLSALINQKTSKKFKIVITIHKDDLQYVSKELQDFITKNRIEIIVADKNLRPHLKYFYVMQKYRNVPIVTVDDDCIYAEDLLESLYKSYKKYPSCVSSRRVHLMKYSKNGRCLPYKKWQHKHRSLKSPSLNLFATGVGGILYPPNILKITEEDLPIIQKSMTNDDIFLKWKENKLGINVVFCEGKTKDSYKPNKSYNHSYALCFENKINNDVIITALNLTKPK